MTFSGDTIREASTRLRGLIVRTPLLEAPQLNELTGTRVLVKAESLQLTGSFKIRGALNAALILPAPIRRNGLVAFSAGNHGQGVAAAAHLLHLPAMIVMPLTAPQVKIDNCRWWGAEVILYDPVEKDREDIANEFVRERGMVLIPPFDHHDVMSGQGTVGLESCKAIRDRSWLSAWLSTHPSDSFSTRHGVSTSVPSTSSTTQ